jgi:hypothetical protein
MALIFLERRAATGLEFWVAIHALSAPETHHPRMFRIVGIAVLYEQVNGSADSPCWSQASLLSSTS